MKPQDIFAVVQPGLEELAEQELISLGSRQYVRIKGGFFLKGHLSTLIRYNLHSRIFTRFLIQIAELPASSFAALKQGLEAIPWQDYLKRQPVCIRVNSYQSALYHEKAIAERVIDSLSACLGHPITVHSSPDIPHTQLILVYVKHDVFTVRLDTTGAHLHKRGYGTHKEDAPLRETVAAAMLRSAHWGEAPATLLDPCCGSGTILLEAALMLLQTPWSQYRRFACEEWTHFDRALYDKINAAALSQQLSSLPDGYALHGSDISNKAIASAQNNAEAARLTDMITWNTANLLDLTSPQNAVIITNPPWGKRLPQHDRDLIRDWFIRQAKRDIPVYLLLPVLQLPQWKLRYNTLFTTSMGSIDTSFVQLTY